MWFVYQIRIGWIRCSGQVLQGESPVIGPGHRIHLLAGQGIPPATMKEFAG